MKITLDSSPANAPGCIRIVAEDGRDILIQTDWDWPGIASTFRWSIKDVHPKPPDCYERWQTGGDVSAEEESECKQYESNNCEHRGTDGTIDCPECGLKAGDFITAARQWIDDNDGATVEDPGYFQ